MMPDNRLSTRPIKGAFLFPENVRSPPLYDREYGGIAIQDPSEGLLFQVWLGYWNAADSTVYVEPSLVGAPVALFTEPDVVEFCFTFDQNMRWSTATRNSSNVLRHRWYDTAVEAYVITEYPGVSSVRLTLDDKRGTQVRLGVSDIILTYVRASQVRWRIQRDRFLTEYTYSGFTVPDDIRITHFGMNKINRLQWRLGPRRVN